MIKKYWFSLFVILLFYFISHLYSLLSLPVFADESIYIRWAQLIIDDWKRYAFFSMNDGKTPLFIWLLVPFQFIFKDQLFAARFLAVLIGFFQIILNILIVKEFKLGRKIQLLTAIITVILPFWYFHHRIALMDGLLTLLISVSYLFLIKILKDKTKNKSKIIRYSIISGISFGLALLTKIPAILFLPVFYVSIFLVEFINQKLFIQSLIKITGPVILGLLIFLLLKFNPAFGQLFSRGGDFLFPVYDFFAGAWKQTLPSFPNYLNYFYTYLTPSIFIFLILGLFSKKNKREIHVLFWSGFLFVLPIALLGRTVYPRYLFPASLFFTLAAAISIGDLLDNLLSGLKENISFKNVSLAVLIVLLISNTIITSFNFIYLSLFDSDKTPFVAADKIQYLTEWSSGHGIKETSQLILAESQNNTIAVATEGYFGTLPDGLLMYLHRQNLENIYVEGIGYPIASVPNSFITRAKDFDRKWLVVNSHRMDIKLDRKNLIAEFCRPFNSPCLQVWDITDNFESYFKY